MLNNRQSKHKGLCGGVSEQQEVEKQETQEELQVTMNSEHCEEQVRGEAAQVIRYLPHKHEDLR